MRDKKLSKIVDFYLYLLTYLLITSLIIKEVIGNVIGIEIITCN